MTEPIELSITRLKRRQDFLRVAANCQKVVRPGLILQASRRPAGVDTTKSMDIHTDARLGLTVSRKVGNAVQRNRAKRRLRALAAALFPGEAKAGYDYVVIGRRNTLTRPFGRLRDDMTAALRLIGQNARGGHPATARSKPRRRSGSGGTQRGR